jgi:hypothetical protein
MRKGEPFNHERKNLTRPDRDITVPHKQAMGMRTGERTLGNSVRKGIYVPDRFRDTESEPNDDTVIDRPDPACDDFAM